ncbi:MAG: tape measure protein, partial [Intrasporangiaceae bacterium]|nr:tape measure protein [Intrasporangiaceae bacterium]
DLERTLKLIADTAQIAGTDIASMGSVFNKVLAKGKLGGDELMQLSDRGLPVLQWLQEELGATADEVKEMVSRGEVDFETFSNAVEKNIGGAALRGGDTTRGAFANMFAAVGRFGAELAGPVFNQAQGFFVMLTGWVDEATEVIGPFAEKIGEFVSGAGPRFEEIALGFKDGLDNTPWQRFGSAARSALDTTQYLFGVVGDAAERVRDTFSGLQERTDTMFGIVRSGTEGSWGRLQGVFDRVLSIVEQLAGPLGSLGVTLGIASATIGVSTWDIFLTTLELVAEVLDTFLIPMLATVVDWLAENQTLVTGLFGAYVAWSIAMKAMAFGKLILRLKASTLAIAAKGRAWLLMRLRGIRAMTDTVRLLAWSAAEHVKKFAIKTGAVIAHVAKVLWGWTVMAAKGAWYVLRLAAHAAVVVAKWALMGVKALFHGAKVVAGWVMTGVAAVAQTVIHVAQAAVVVAKWAWMGVQALFHAAKMAAAWFIALGPIGWVILAIAALVALIIIYWDEIKAWTIAAFTAIWEFIKQAWDWVKEKTSEVADWISSTWDTVIGWFTSLPGRIAAAASGMWDGIKDSFRSMLNWIIDLWNNFGFTIGGFQLPAWLGGGTSPSFTVSTPNIPRLHQGGTVTGGGLTNIRPNEEVVMLPQASRVIPLPAGERIDQSILGRDGSDRPMIAKVYIDRREVAEAVFEVAGDVMARR